MNDNNTPSHPEPDHNAELDVDTDAPFGAGHGTNRPDLLRYPGAEHAYDELPYLAAVNWRTLDADEATAQWYDLDDWVTWLRTEYGLPPTIIPPLWHRHRELVWELSALHLYWESTYSPGAPPEGPLTFHRLFAEARTRLREWVATCGTHLDRDRPTRTTTWPGEPTRDLAAERQIIDRQNDFDAFVAADTATRPHEPEPSPDEHRGAAGDGSTGEGRDEDGGFGGIGSAS